MINHILLATDGSEHSRRATELAADLAERVGADLVETRGNTAVFH